MRKSNDVALLLLFLLLWRPSSSETIPTLHVQSFADVQVDLPTDLRDRVGVLVLGFSRRSSIQTRRWNELILQDYGNDAHVAYYQAAVLADVPPLIRGVVLRGIRNPMPPGERAHFVYILQDAAKWKEAAHFTSADDAYVLVIGVTGQIEWRSQGAGTPESYRQLKQQIANAQKSTAG